MLFEVHNPTTSRTSHCGVLEFVAEEGMIYMPYWVFIPLLLQYYCAVFVWPVRVLYYLNVWASWSLLGVSPIPLVDFQNYLRDLSVVCCLELISACMKCFSDDAEYAAPRG